jgi:hypothetical protein
MIDIRFPLGLMFSIFGVILTIYGLATIGQHAIYVISLGVNVNLISGIFTLIFGLVMLFFSEPVRSRIRKITELQLIGKYRWRQCPQIIS